MAASAAKMASTLDVHTELVRQLSKAVRSLVSITNSVKASQLVYTPSNASTSRDPNFKSNVIKAYQPSAYDEATDQSRQMCKCMVLDVSLLLGFVTASHLFKFKWHLDVQQVLGFRNINDTKNGLLLAKSVFSCYAMSLGYGVLTAESILC